MKNEHAPDGLDLLNRLFARFAPNDFDELGREERGPVNIRVLSSVRDELRDNRANYDAGTAREALEFCEARLAKAAARNRPGIETENNGEPSPPPRGRHARRFQAPSRDVA
ncbi:MAG: hypothetical protein P4M15_08900 [Alphaproteobacteria bacterium]|nr:hypothetical protein [Alphaproteobacteria bacterium]